MERLQKVLAHAGVASRRQSEKLIMSGRVKVNGAAVTELGTKVGVHDQILVDGVPISSEAPIYI
ncbi:S4 domain-containing protein, partial [Mycobacterium kansasii]